MRGRLLPLLFLPLLLLGGTPPPEPPPPAVELAVVQFQLGRGLACDGLPGRLPKKAPMEIWVYYPLYGWRLFESVWLPVGELFELHVPFYGEGTRMLLRNKWPGLGPPGDPGECGAYMNLHGWMVPEDRFPEKREKWRSDR